jgi:hypothetical protein
MDHIIPMLRRTGGFRSGSISVVELRGGGGRCSPETGRRGGWSWLRPSGRKRISRALFEDAKYV